MKTMKMNTNRVSVMIGIKLAVLVSIFLELVSAYVAARTSGAGLRSFSFQQDFVLTLLYLHISALFIFVPVNALLTLFTIKKEKLSKSNTFSCIVFSFFSYLLTTLLFSVATILLFFLVPTT